MLKWYYSETHVALMQQLSGGGARPGGPLADVPDEGPVLAVASLTFEPQRQLCDVKRAHAGVSATPGRDPMRKSTSANSTPRSRHLGLLRSAGAA